MSVYYINGDLLKSRHHYICHQVNCQGRMGSGIAKQIKAKWPAVYDAYRAKFQEMENEITEMCSSWEIQMDVSEVLLGHIQIVPVNDKQNVINMFAQQYYGYDGLRYTSYDAFWDCLNKIKETIPKGSEIAFPDHIGCGLGGANWSVIQSMIYAALNEDYNVYIYRLEEQ